jgi:ATP-dependent Lon protease
MCWDLEIGRGKYENNDSWVVTGLPWTRVGGILFIESALSRKGTWPWQKQEKVMKESAAIALEYIKSNAAILV